MMMVKQFALQSACPFASYKLKLFLREDEAGHRHWLVHGFLFSHKCRAMHFTPVSGPIFHAMMMKCCHITASIGALGREL